MNENSQQKEVVLGKSEKSDVRTNLILNGGVAVHGTHLVSQKVLAVLSEVLKLDREGEDFGVWSVAFRNDGTPKGKLGMAYPDTNSIAINLAEIWELSTLILEDGEKHLSLTGLVWETVLMTMFHEINHIDGCRVSEFRDKMEKDHKAADEHAEEWAREIRVDMAKQFDIEPPAMADMPFFGTKLMELMTTKAEEKWVSEAAALISDGVIYQDLENDERITTYREYVRGLVDPKLEDKSWDQGFSAIDFVFGMEDGGTTVIEEPKAEVKIPVAEVVDIAPAAIEAAEPNHQQTMEAGATDGEAGMTIGAEEPTITPSAEMLATLDEDVAIETQPGPEALAAAEGEMKQLFTEAVVVEATPVEALVKPGPEVGTVVAGGAVAAEPTAQTEQEQAEWMKFEASGEQAELDAINAEAADFTDTVTLPDHILAEQAQMAAAATAVPQAFQPKTPLQPVNMTGDQVFAYMKDVYMRLYSNIFNKCGRILNNDQPFENPGAVLDALSLADLTKHHNAEGLIIGFESLNAQSGKVYEEFAGHVRGIVFTKSNPHGLPAYVIYLNLGGVSSKRSLVSQNPSKLNANTGMLSTTALEARAGHAIAWIMCDAPGNKFKAEIKDNVYRVL